MNLFSSATNCSYVNAVRALRGLPPPLPLPFLPSLTVPLFPMLPPVFPDFFFLPVPPPTPPLLLLPLLLFPSRSSLTSLPSSSLLLLVSSRSCSRSFPVEQKIHDFNVLSGRNVRNLSQHLGQGKNEHMTLTDLSLNFLCARYLLLVVKEERFAA